MLLDPLVYLSTKAKSTKMLLASGEIETCPRKSSAQVVFVIALQPYSSKAARKKNKNPPDSFITLWISNKRNPPWDQHPR
jgi:hypothetical protein